MLATHLEVTHGEDALYVSMREQIDKKAIQKRSEQSGAPGMDEVFQRLVASSGIMKLIKHH